MSLDLSAIFRVNLKNWNVRTACDETLIKKLLKRSILFYLLSGLLIEVIVKQLFPSVASCYNILVTSMLQG
jgi:hypothetical protein